MEIHDSNNKGHFLFEAPKNLNQGFRQEGQGTLLNFQGKSYIIELVFPVIVWKGTIDAPHFPLVLHSRTFHG